MLLSKLTLIVLTSEAGGRGPRSQGRTVCAGANEALAASHQAVMGKQLSM